MTDAAEAGMVRLRLIAGAEEAPHALRVPEDSPAVASLVRIAGSPDRRIAGSPVRPPGDLILCDVAREEVSVVVSQLRRSGSRGAPRRSGRWPPWRPWPSCSA